MLIISDDVRVLQDLRESGKERPWKRYKQQSLELSKSYKRIGNKKKSKRCECCGGFLEFKECDNGHKKLKSAKFCQLRLCPMCSARRSVLVFQNLRDVIHIAKERERLEFIFLTLTAKSVHNDQICDELTKYFESWEKLAKRRPFKSSIIGWFRALEITHNWKKDLYHPHFHCLLAVKPSYFSGGNYIRQEIWAQWWKDSLGLDYMPIVDVRRVKPRKKDGDINGAIMETAKYNVKSNDYLIPGNKQAQDLAVEVLDKALHRRRLVAYGGIFKEIRKGLNQKDEDQHDLIKVGDDQGEGCTCSICGLIYKEVSYHWHVGYKDYVRVPDQLMIGSKGQMVDEETGEITDTL